VIDPGEFIHLAEEAGLILEIGKWVLTYALDRCREWLIAYPESPLCRVAVNISPIQFRQADFTFQVERVLAEKGMSGGCLTLELTENMLMDDVEATIAKFRQLKRIGVRFSIDDFGIGYSSLASLKRLPLDEIKIDRSFIQDISTDHRGAMLVDTMLTMARHLRLEAVAEGVESAAELEFLLEHGCHLFQGYHLHRPLPPDDFASRLAAAASPLKSRAAT